jgi:hypothetical protein
MMAESFQRTMVGETSDTEKYIDTLRRSEHLQPEKDLLLAILHDAIDTYRKYRGARDPEGKKQFRDAEEWIMDGGDDWVFSFEHICDCLGLHPDYIRRGVLALKVKIAGEKPPQRRGMRRQAA